VTDSNRPTTDRPDDWHLEARPRCTARNGTGARCELEAGHGRLHMAGPSEWLEPPPGWKDG
jgi:hypothetical protein